MDNNLVIATSPDVTDWSKCMAVNLPQGSDIRKYGNLADNPAVYKKSILVNGSLSGLLGLPGVQCPGTTDSFEIDGVVIGGGDTPVNPGNGNGTKDNPYTVEQIMTSTADAADVWVEGYVVGYVPDMKFDEAVFGNTPTEGSTNYTNGTNLVLSSQPAGSASALNSIPVGLSTSVRSVLAISKNPEIYGKKVKVKGSLEKYFGLRGIKSVSEYEIEGEGGGGGNDTPVTPGASGSGTEADPFNVEYVTSSTTDASGVWVVGYVAGYVPDMKWDGAVFSASAPATESTNYTNGTNCVLSSVPAAQATLENSMPVGLSTSGDVRANVAVGKNPAAFGKKVMLKGDITKYFGQRAMKNVTEYKFLD